MKKPYEEFNNIELISYAILVGGGRNAKELSSLKNLLKDNAPEEVEEFFYNFYNRFIKRDFHANRNNRKKYLENLLKEEYEKVMEMQTPLEDGIKINDNIVCDAFTNIVVDLNYFIKMYPDVYLKKYYEKDISKYLNSSLPYLEALISNRLINIKNFSELLCIKMIDKSLVKDFDSKTVKSLLKMADYTVVDKEIIKHLEEQKKKIFGNKTDVLINNFYEKAPKRYVNEIKKDGAISLCSPIEKVTPGTFSKKK